MKGNAVANEKVLACKNLSFTASEAYKLLRTNILFSIPGNKSCRIIGVTSSIRSEGKSVTAENLAYTLVETGKRVLIVDADMRLPTLAKKLGIRSKPGLSNVLAGITPLSSALQHPDNMRNWCALPAGDVPPNPSELLGSERMQILIEKLSEHFEFIVVDLPPVNIVADALVVSSWIDGLLMVVRENFSDRQNLAAAIDKLEPMKDKILGFVYNDAADPDKSYGKYKRHGNYGRYSKYKNYGSYRNSGYGYDYGYGYGKQPKTKEKKAK